MKNCIAAADAIDEVIAGTWYPERMPGGPNEEYILVPRRLLENIGRDIREMSGLLDGQRDKRILDWLEENIHNLIIRSDNEDGLSILMRQEADKPPWNIFVEIRRGPPDYDLRGLVEKAMKIQNEFQKENKST